MATIRSITEDMLAPKQVIVNFKGHVMLFIAIYAYTFTHMEVCQLSPTHLERPDSMAAD